MVKIDYVLKWNNHTDGNKLWDLSSLRIDNQTT